MRRTRIPLKFLWVFPTLVLFLLFTSAQGGADQQELEQIRHAIKAKGARWDADETSVSKLTPAQRKMRLGLNHMADLMVEAPEPLEPPAAFDLEAAPLSLDWRSLNGANYVSPVRNQGSCGSCWAFAVTAALESQVMIDTGYPADLSEQILVSCSGAGTCSGGSPSTASNYLRDVGLPPETCFQYTATNNSCENACPNWKADTYKVLGWHKAGASVPTVDEIKSALYGYGPVVATMYVYSDFFSYRSGVYSYVTGTCQGGHAVLVVGYDDLNNCFIVKNSWGTGWGEAGYFRIAYSEVRGPSYFGYSALAYDGFGDPPTPPPPCSFALSASVKKFKAAGGSGSFTVSSQSGCSWTTQCEAAWISITAGSSGVGTGTVTYTVQPNLESTSRSAVLTVQGLAYQVTQAGARIPRNNK